MPWYGPAIKTRDVLGNNAGRYTQGSPKGLLHTTEGKTFAGALAAYRNNNSWPHFTVSYEKGFFQVWQHLDIVVAARSLKAGRNGVETNRNRVVQIEIVGTCDIRNKDSWGKQYVGNFPKGYLDGIKELMRWIERNHGVPRKWFAKALIAYPFSYGTNNGVRLSAEDWTLGSGWCGHQNAFNNLHGDPGLLNITYLLLVPEPTPPKPPVPPTPVPTPPKKDSMATQPFMLFKVEGTGAEADKVFKVPADFAYKKHVKTQQLLQGYKEALYAGAVYAEASNWNADVIPLRESSALWQLIKSLPELPA